MLTELQAPFPWFGGKSRVAPLVWERFGDVKNYVEPFAGSLAVLLQRPHYPFAENRIETANDIDGYLANFWRALKNDPDAVAEWADNPVNENDLHARHSWLVRQKEDFVKRLEGDQEFFDAKVAGWWVWGICCWIGGGWCSGKGPWHSKNGLLVRDGNAGRGVNRTRPHLGNGMGVRRQRPLVQWFQDLADRLKRVRVCCGSWDRVCTTTPTTKQGLTGVFLDPPYSAEAGRDGTIYAHEDLTVAHAVREWAIENGDNPLMRIALCGYEGEHAMPESWSCVAWKAHGGYGNQTNKRGKANAGRERIWFSPNCLTPNSETNSTASLYAESELSVEPVDAGTA